MYDISRGAASSDLCKNILLIREQETLQIAHADGSCGNSTLRVRCLSKVSIHALTRKLVGFFCHIVELAGDASTLEPISESITEHLAHRHPPFSLTHLFPHSFAALVSTQILRYDTI